MLLSLLAGPAVGAIDTHQFDDPVHESRYRSLIAELRCPKCQNQNIADSNAPLSADLRQKVYLMIQAGRDDREIVDYLVARYGDFITYRPPLKPATWILWFGPLVAIGIAILGLAVWVRRRRQGKPPELSDGDTQRLRALLEDSRKDRNPC
jgi:cytochrome c-type biogenesis protein CcmH